MSEHITLPNSVASGYET